MRINKSRTLFIKGLIFPYENISILRLKLFAYSQVAQGQSRWLLTTGSGVQIPPWEPEFTPRRIWVSSLALTDLGVCEGFLFPQKTVYWRKTQRNLLRMMAQRGIVFPSIPILPLMCEVRVSFLWKKTRK